MEAIAGRYPAMPRTALLGAVLLTGLLGGAIATHVRAGSPAFEALVHLTKTLSDQLGPDGITVNIVHPGVTRTEHVELASRRASGLTGESIAVDGGLSRAVHL